MEPEPIAPQDAAEPLLDLEVWRHAACDILPVWRSTALCISNSHLVCRRTQTAMPGTPELLGCCLSLARARARRWSWRRCGLLRTNYARCVFTYPRATELH